MIILIDLYHTGFDKIFIELEIQVQAMQEPLQG